MKHQPKLKRKPKVEPLSYPSHFNYVGTGLIREEFSTSGWVETRQQWRLYLTEKYLFKSLQIPNDREEKKNES
jgi:hypothetical protein